MTRETASPIRLDIVIVNWNSGRQLADCLASLADAKTGEFELGQVVIVDNDSSDDSLQGVEDFILPLRVIRNVDNRGFAAACNQGALAGGAEYILFLNPDTRLFSVSLTEPLSFMERAENRSIGITGIQLVDDSGQVARSCARFPTPATILAQMLALDRLLPQIFPPHFMTEWDHAESRNVDQVIGAFFLTRRALYQALGGFDERFFVYFEEVDFSFRARQAGWRSFYLAGAEAYHKGEGTSAQAKAARLFYYLRSRIRFCFKHFALPAAVGIMLATLLLEPLSRLALATLRLSVSEVRELAKGYARLWGAVPDIIKSLVVRRPS